MNRISFFSLASLLLGLLLTTASFTWKTNAPKPGIRRAATHSFVGPRWQMSSFRLEPAIDLDGDGKLDSDLLGFMSGCDRDNSLVFEPTGKIVLSEEASRCGKAFSSNGKPTTWSYDKVSHVINIGNRGKAGSVSRWEVVEASAKTMTIRTMVTDGGKTTTATLTWKAI